MKAVVVEAGEIRMQHDRPRPDPAPGKILVKVLRAGICETDLQIIQGYMNFQGVLGHEFVGIAQTGRFAGQRVVGEINCSCHLCPTCDAGLATHCPHRSVIGILNRDGAFAEYLTVPERNLHAVPDHLGDDSAVFVEPLAAAFQIPHQLPHLAGKRVIVLGDGRLGQLCAQVLRHVGVEVMSIGKHERKLDRLRRMKIEVGMRDEVTPNHRADVVVDCTGSSSGITDAFAWLRPRGTLVMKTTVAGTPSLTLAPIVIDELQVIGSRCGPFAPAIQALADGSIPVDDLVEARYPLSEAPAAFEALRQKSMLKVLLDFD